MRHLAAEHSNTKRSFIRIVNPVSIPEDTNTCPYFHVIRKVRVAWGTKRLFDHLPHSKAGRLKSQIMAYFGKTLYYRIYRKEKGLMPDQQEMIRHIFRKNGFPEEPAFEYYTDEYLWG